HDLEPDSVQPTLSDRPPSNLDRPRISRIRAVMMRLIVGVVLAGCVAILVLAGRRMLQRRATPRAPGPSAALAAPGPSPQAPPSAPPSEPAANAANAATEAAPAQSSPVASSGPPRASPPAKAAGHHVSAPRKQGGAVRHPAH